MAITKYGDNKIWQNTFSVTLTTKLPLDAFILLPHIFFCFRLFMDAPTRVQMRKNREIRDQRDKKKRANSLPLKVTDDEDDDGDKDNEENKDVEDNEYDEDNKDYEDDKGNEDNNEEERLRRRIFANRENGKTFLTVVAAKKLTMFTAKKYFCIFMATIKN